MSETDDLAPAEADTAITDSPPAAPEGEPTEQEINWQKRAEDAQAWATRAAQEAAELRQWQESIRNDPDEQRKLIEELGFALPDDDETDPEDEEPTTALEKRLAAIEAKEAAKEAQQEQERQLAEAERHFSTAFKDLGVEDEDEQNAVIGLALTMPPGDDGMPPVAEAHKQLEALWAKRAQQQTAAKRRPTHSFSPNGVAGDDKPDLSTHEGRVANAMAKLADPA